MISNRAGKEDYRTSPFFRKNYIVSASLCVALSQYKIIFRNQALILPGHGASHHNRALIENSSLTHTSSDCPHGQVLYRLAIITPTVRTHSDMHSHQAL